MNEALRDTRTPDSDTLTPDFFFKSEVIECNKMCVGVSHVTHLPSEVLVNS